MNTHRHADGPTMLLSLLALASAHTENLPLPLARNIPLDPPEPAPGRLIRVAAVQIADFTDGVTRNGTQEMAARTAKAVAYIERAAATGAHIAMFPEMALAQYSGPSLAQGTLSESSATVAAAERAIAAACRAHGITAIVGIPLFFAPGGDAPATSLPKWCTPAKCWYNTALVLGPDGRKLYRQAKMHTAGPDGKLGVWLDTFTLPHLNLTASIQICYDVYFTQMSVLPVLKGSQVALSTF